MPENLLALTNARKGHFKLESGHHGDLWLDLDRLFQRPAEVGPLIARLAARLAGYGAAAVCGPQLGGALLAYAIAAELSIEFAYTERLAPVAYRLPGAMRSRLRGLDVALVDDAINAGSAVRGTLAELEAAGARPVVIGALLVLGSWTPGPGVGRDLPLETVARLESGVWLPVDCPLCAAQVPLEEIDGGAGLAEPP